MKRLVCAVLVAATLPASSDAGGCKAVVSTTSVVQAASLVVTPFAVPVAVPVTVINPSGVLFAYGSPQPSAAVQAAPSCTCPTCGGRADQAKGAAAPSKHPGADVLLGRCAKCHTGNEAKGGIALFVAGPEAVPIWRVGWQEHAQAVFAAVLDGNMPKGGDPLSPEEKLAIIEYLRAVPAK